MLSGRRATALGAALVLGLGFASAAGACDFCLLSQGISPLETMRGNGIKLTERYTLLNRAYSGTDRVDDFGAEEKHWTTEVTAFYSPLPHLTLLAVVPYRDGSMNGEYMVGLDGEPMGLDREASGDASGIGDVALLARYTFLARDEPGGTTRVAVLGGVKLPTGKTDARMDNGMEYLDSHMQPGTGSTDALVGLSLNYGLRRLSFAVNLLGTVTGEGEFGDTPHRFGNALNYDAGVKYRVLPGDGSPRGPQFFVALGVSGEARGKETTDGDKDENTGGHTVYLTPGLQLSLAPHWVFDLTYQAAIYHDLNGTQLGETSKTVGGVTYLF